MKFIKVVFILGILGLLAVYFIAFKPNFNTSKAAHIYIPSGATYNHVLDTLQKYEIVKQDFGFNLIVNLLKYNKLVKPGKYNISEKQGNLSFIRKIRNGIQDPVKVTLSNIDSPQELAQKLGKCLELDSSDFAAVILDSNSAIENPDIRWGKFLCDTYQLYWTTTPQNAMERMRKEFDRFWNAERTAKAKSLGLTPMQTVILASIVQKETYKTDEQAKIARVYINRIQQGIPLQADPTVKFALGDPTIKRVLNKDLSIDSPYNTYKYSGLIPGPICLPEISCIKEVLNAPKHDYIFFCAAPDFSGYHVFATNARDHQNNAIKYQQALNTRKIYR
jgi:UPF0755 protein